MLFRSGTISVNLSGAADFQDPDGAWDIQCAVFAPAGDIVTVGWVFGTPNTIQVLTWFNATGGTINTGVGINVGAYCTGP